MKAFTTILMSGMVIISPCMAETLGKHLFILSGQSNMYHLKPGDSFLPAVEKAFGKENVSLAMIAKRGAAIRFWDKDYPWGEGVPQGRAKPGKPRKTREEYVKEFGNLYDKLWSSVQDKAKGKNFETVTFVWMQGESDSSEAGAEKYFASFDRVVSRLKRDLGIQSMNIVMGRLSDCGNSGKGWLKMRELQVKYAEEREYCAWVNTDDLNDRPQPDGSTKNDLHYTEEGYVILGQRFAEKAIALIKKRQSAN